MPIWDGFVPTEYKAHYFNCQLFLSYGRRNEAARRRDRNLWRQQHCREVPELDVGADVYACAGYRERFRDCDESVCLDSFVDGDLDVWDGDRLFPVYEQERDQAPDEGIRDDIVQSGVHIRPVYGVCVQCADSDQQLLRIWYAP